MIRWGSLFFFFLQLADLANLTQPWLIDPADFTSPMAGFKNSPETEPISLSELEREYCRVTQQPYPITEMGFARSWMLFRVRHSLQNDLVTATNKN